MLTTDDLSFAVEDSLVGSKAAKEAWPSYGMSEEVAVPPGKGREVVVMAGENDVIETKKRVLSGVVEKLKENGFHVSFKVVEGGRYLIPLESPGAIVDALTSISKLKIVSSTKCTSSIATIGELLVLRLCQNRPRQLAKHGL